MITPQSLKVMVKIVKMDDDNDDDFAIHNVKKPPLTALPKDIHGPKSTGTI